MIRVKLSDDGLWVCHAHLGQHNHSFVAVRQRYLLRSAKFLNKDIFAAVADLMGNGIRPADAIRVISNEVGGLESLGLTKRMFYNYLSAERASELDIGDASLLLDTFKRRASEDVDFFYEVLVDSENRLSSFIWIDEVMKADYTTFGDVVVFDTTFRTNRYNMFCAPFIGLNNHKQNVVFAVAFLVGQKREHFVWCFKCFKRGMGGKLPQTIMID